MQLAEPLLADYRQEEWYTLSRRVLQTVRYGRWPRGSVPCGIRTEGWVVGQDLAAAYKVELGDLLWALREHQKKKLKDEGRFEIEDLDGDGTVWVRDPVCRAGEVERERGRRREAGGGDGGGGGDGRHGRECWRWKATGGRSCKFGDHCKFVHVLPHTM